MPVQRQAVTWWILTALIYHIVNEQYHLGYLQPSKRSSLKSQTEGLCMPCDHEALKLEKGNPRHQDKVNCWSCLSCKLRNLKFEVVNTKNNFKKHTPQQNLMESFLFRWTKMIYKAQCNSWLCKQFLSLNKLQSLMQTLASPPLSERSSDLYCSCLRCKWEVSKKQKPQVSK